MGNGNSGGAMGRDVKWIIGTIVATGIGAVLIVNSFARHEASHLQAAMQDQERRINNSASGVIVEFHRLLHTLQDHRRERMGDIEDRLNRVGRSLDALRDSPHGKESGEAKRLGRIAQELKKIRRLIDSDDSAESSAETLENIRQELAEIRRRLPAAAPPEAETVGDPGETSTNQVTEQNAETR